MERTNALGAGFFSFFSCGRIIGHSWEDWEKCMHKHASFSSFFVAKGVEAKHVGIRARERKKDRGCKLTPWIVKRVCVRERERKEVE